MTFLHKISRNKLLVTVSIKSKHDTLSRSGHYQQEVIPSEIAQKDGSFSELLMQRQELVSTVKDEGTYWMNTPDT